MADEIQNLIINVQGRDNVLQLREAVAQEEAALIKSIAAHGAHSVAAFKNAQAIQWLQTELKKEESLVAKSSLGIKGYGQAALTASYAFQDFTSVQGSFSQKLSSIQNNIPGLIMAIGGPGMAGLAGAVSVVSVGIGLAVPIISGYVDKLEIFKEAAHASADEATRLTERIKEIEKEPIKLGVDMHELEVAKARLDQLRRDQAAFNALASGRTTFEKEAGDSFRQSFEESGKEGLAARDAVAGQIAGEKNATSPGLTDIDTTRNDIRFAENDLASAFDPASRRLAQTKIDMAKEKLARLEKAAPDIRAANLKAAQGETGDLFQSAFDGNNKGKRDNLINRLRGAGKDSLATDLSLSTPEEMEKQNDIENAFQANDDAWKGGGKVARQRRLELERKIAATAQEKADRLHNNAQGNGFDPKVMVFPKGRRPGGGAGGGGGIPDLGGGGAPDEFAMPGATLAQQVKPKSIQGKITLNAKRLREAREAKAFRARVRVANKRTQQAGNGVRATAGPARRAAPPDGQGANQAAQGILQQNGQLVDRIKMLETLLGQVERGMKMQGAQLGGNARRGMQDNDSFLPAGR